MDTISTQTNTTDISVGQWLITFLILAIPIVGFVMLFVYAFGSNTQKTKQNWAKASLIMLAVITVLYFFLFASLLASF